MKHHFPFVSHNLETKKREDLSFPFEDYGFLYGYGLFETILVNKGLPVFLKEHVARLNYGANIFEISFPFNLKTLETAVADLIEKNQLSSGVLNIYLTPGQRRYGSRRYDFSDPLLLMVNRVVTEDASEIVLAVREESFQRTRMDRFKTLASMKNILEKRLSSQFDDILLYNHTEEILESPLANVFFVQENRLVTPKSPLILPGIVRQYLLDNQKDLSLPITERVVYRDELESFDEIFLTNSLRGIIMVKKTDHYPHLKSGHIAHTIRDFYNRKLNLN